MGTHDVFICFSSNDEAIARRIVRFLEARQLMCWLSSRDVGPGESYREAIVAALENAKVMVFLFSEFSGKSGEIKKELALAGSCGATVIPLRLSSVTPSGALQYELATRQWIDAFPDFQPALERLAAAVSRVVHPANAGGAGNGSGRPYRGSAEPITVTPPEPPIGRRPAGMPMVPAESEDFEIISKLLARSIGPIARVFVEKASTDARSLDDLCERLAVHVRTPADRIAFRQAARGQLRCVAAAR